MKLTAKQEEAYALLTGPATHVLLEGGSRSGKTAVAIHRIISRALKAPGSRHAILRFRFNHIKSAIIYDTFPKVAKLAFPGVKYHLDKSDWFARIGEDAQIWFGGLDDKERTEKILGNEYATIMLNEVSQIAFAAREMAVTRLAQSVKRIDGKPLALKMFYDENPPSKAHWSYRLFVEKRDPETKKPLRNPEDYAYLQMNPGDNAENLPPGYLKTLQGLSSRLQKRFLLGEFADATPNQLFSEEAIDRWRELDGQNLPGMVRIVVGVDPSGSGDADNAEHDAIGIVVGGLGTDGKAYLLEDCTVNVGPAVWGKIATDAFERHDADVVVAEANFGGAMVQHTIQTARKNTPYKPVTASRGKMVRAEPFSALYEQGRVRHVGYFRELEDELAGFSTVGYMGERSPNRADAWIWVLSELFPAMVNHDDSPDEDMTLPDHGRSSVGGY